MLIVAVTKTGSTQSFFDVPPNTLNPSLFKDIKKFIQTQELSLSSLQEIIIINYGNRMIKDGEPRVIARWVLRSNRFEIET